MTSEPKKISFSFGKKPASSSQGISSSAQSSSSASRSLFSFSLGSSQRSSAGAAPAPAASNVFRGGPGFFEQNEEEPEAVQQVLSISKEGGWETEGGAKEKAPLVIPCLNLLNKPAASAWTSSQSSSVDSRAHTGLLWSGAAKDESSVPCSSGEAVKARQTANGEKKVKEPNYLRLAKPEERVKSEPVEGADASSSSPASTEGASSASPKPEFGLSCPTQSRQVKTEPTQSSSAPPDPPPVPAASSSLSLDEMAAQALIAEAKSELGSPAFGTAAPILPILSRNEKLAELRRRHKERLKLAKERPASASLGSSSSRVRGRGFVACDLSSGLSSDRISWLNDARGSVKEEPRDGRERQDAAVSRETSEKELLQEELNLLPDAPSTTSSAYSAIPVSEFGLAMLRGMGYDPEKDKKRKEEEAKEQKSGTAPKRKRAYNRAGLGSEEEIERLWEEREKRLREENARDKKRKMDEMLRRRREG
ncbi:hypothetical protein BESB_023180 [Besnoitia besnoiti]|uniref:Spp2/MOS2 G-patch domain-containing protein n=1 Tax=Besnoitia besnoiti TaxID=94643 RepID=A0A2A9M7F7_BESBE|nr:hypothetical protein BESB_023180 [Besnoitia besnoiti]PFH31826.1 hypothetical protein BESB_023180 [Besnoitia besnoiti]